MSGIKDQENIDDLRKRLYERGGNSVITKRHELTDKPIVVARGWGETSNDGAVTPQLTQSSPAEIKTETDILSEDNLVQISETDIKSMKKKRSFRTLILLFSFGVLVLSIIVSSIYMLFGGNQISANNISITMTAPFAIAGGEIVPLQINIKNDNAVSIESATLILNYPTGTKSADETARDLYEERLPLADIKAGEAIDIPVKAVLFGEENEDKEIKATVEYRVSNSNGTFFKDAEPVHVKINSSPLVLRVEAVDKVSSGQEIDVTLTLQSNATTPMRNVLVSADYPNSFSLIRSEPTTSQGQNTWLVEEILPNKTYVIKLRGLITGLSNETSEIQFKAGNPKADNQFVLGSILTQTKTGYLIEKPFIGVKVNINGDDDGSVLLNSGVDTNVVVYVTNTLDESVYDMRVELAPSGNIIRDDRIKVDSGFYESSSKKINWEISSMSSLQEVRPGEKRDFKLNIKPDENQATGAFDVSVKVFARRVGEANASEELIGTALAEAKYSSKIKVSVEAGHQSSPFSDKGPVPPVAGKETDYTITLEASAGVNDVTGAVLTTSLPQYVAWLNETEGDGKIEYNPVSKQIKWDISEIKAKTSKQIKLHVTLLPSVTHIGRTLTLLEGQDLRANDRFTDVLLQAKNEMVDNELSEELGFKHDNGIVQSE